MTTTTVTLTGLGSLRDWGWFDSWLPQAVDDVAAGGFAAVVAVLVALGVGVAHALGPGHGKVLIAAYLAGTDGRRRDAAALGWLVAAMHTGSVLALGASYLLIQRIPGGQAFDRTLDVVVAVAIVTVGIGLLRRAWSARSAPEPSAASTGAADPRDDAVAGPTTDAEAGLTTDAGAAQTTDPGAGQTTDPGAGQTTDPEDAGTSGSAPAITDHGHHHALPAGVAPLTRPGVITLAAAGGLVPSPAAFLALVTAVALGRPWLGLLLVGSFSVGLALTLTAIGLVVVAGRDRLLAPGHDHQPRSLRWLAHRLPWITAFGVLLAGFLLLARAVWPT